MRVLPATVLLGFFGLFAPAPATACNCGGANPSCPQIGTHFLPFVALVERVTNETQVYAQPDGQMIGSAHRVALVKVLEDFTGKLEPGDEVEVRTGTGGGDCGYSFTEGRTYLIDANTRDGKFWTSICSGTVPEPEATLALRQLRTPPSSWRAPDVWGFVLRHSSVSEETAQPVAMPGVPVSLTGLDGVTFRAVTDKEGSFEFPSVPASSYAVHVDLPPELMTASGENAGGVAVPAWTNGLGAGCVVRVDAFAAGRVMGSVKNIRGEPLEGHVSAVRYPPGAGHSARWVPETIVNKDGEFELGPLDAGQYWLLFVPKEEHGKQWFYPGTRDTMAAKPVLVQQALPTGGLNFVIPN